MEYQEFQERLCNPGGFCPEDLLKLLQRCTQECRSCALGAAGSPAVVGLGPASARLMIVGGHSTAEDVSSGRPLSGPAGEILEEAFQGAGIGAPDVYLTNAVKHASPGSVAGGRALNVGVGSANIGPGNACRHWLRAETDVVKPEIVLCMGEVAAECVLGRAVDLPRQRGAIFHPGFVPSVMVTLDAAEIAGMAAGPQRDRAIRDLIIELYEAVDVLGAFDPFRGREALAQL
ncbi:MAG: hypothetical protein GXX83_10615 [Gaiellales bacterium]|nr:hypothetical protein [Gaiellales bacterium]